MGASTEYQKNFSLSKTMALYIGSDGKQHRLDNTLFYKEKGKQAYLLIFTDTARIDNDGSLYDCYCPLYKHDDADRFAVMCHGSCSDEYLKESCTRTSFKRLPVAWQKGFKEYIEYDPTAD